MSSTEFRQSEPGTYCTGSDVAGCESGTAEERDATWLLLMLVVLMPLELFAEMLILMILLRRRWGLRGDGVEYCCFSPELRGW